MNLLCFDLDGTLIDSAHDITRAVNQTLVEYDKSPLPHEVVVSHIGEGLLVLLEGVFPTLPDGLPATSLVEHFLKNYENEMLKTTKPFEGVLDFLHEWIESKGLIAIITNKNERMAKIILEHLGMHKLPWVDIFGADTLAEKKPSPLPLFTMMEKAKVSPHQTIMIGDGTPDIKSATAAKVKSIAIEFGYTKPEILLSLKPTATLAHYNQLNEVIHRISSL